MTHSTQYETLDLRIIEHIASGLALNPLYGRVVRGEAGRIAKLTGRDEFRIIDGRLQALRKAGRITADRKAPGGWILTEQPS